MEQPTINENPTVLTVDRKRKVQKLRVFGSESAADFAVQRALTEASLASHGKGVQLIKNMGVTLPSEVPASFPFAFSPMIWTGETADGDEKEEEMKSAANEKQSIDDSTEDQDEVNADEVFEIVRNIQDPEHPLTLEQLGVVSREQIVLDQRPAGSSAGHRQRLEVRFTPTIPHCSMATQIGLCLRVKLDRSLPLSLYKTTVKIEPGTHASEHAINKQLADKERVCAALENKHLLGIVNRCIMNGMSGNMT